MPTTLRNLREIALCERPLSSMRTMGVHALTLTALTLLMPSVEVTSASASEAKSAVRFALNPWSIAWA